MKFLICQDCESVTTVRKSLHRIATCLCARHSIWRDTPETVTVHDAGTEKDPPAPRAMVLILHTVLVAGGHTVNDRDDVTDILDSVPDGHLLKQMGSLVATVRPGEYHKAKWATELPSPRW
jgi:hypothetical protein